MTKTEALVLSEVRTAMPGVARLVLAVSGGVDSMVLLDAVSRVCPERVACVATFDHGSGPWATQAADQVEARATVLGFPVARGRAVGHPGSEAAMRDARWHFLHAVARDHHARVATAHTRDDQVETVFLRALRGAGARGLAALFAPSDVVRPLLSLARSDIARYARARQLAWIEDPSNASRRFLRNRVRLDLLPACNRVRPGLSDELLDLAARAAALRRELDDVVGSALQPAREGDSVVVARTRLAGYDAPMLRLIWPVLAAQLGIAMDRRGTERAAQFTTQERAGGRIQLSGGYEIVRQGDRLRLRHQHTHVEADTESTLRDGTVFAGFRFRRTRSRNPFPKRAPSLWEASFSAEAALTVRGWHPGDRMTPAGARGPRRIKGLLRDAGVDAASRTGWPVVLSGEEIVWVPGVRRGEAATVRSGRPEVLFRCEHNDR
ncbi:MAG TPA: tRNA lysidine(34) synthetase TilS [Gemmatimonadaceae bacterium]|nr:tRNA lysidine(34) synthetase TilS [Gemmatimonadaceae bacterium]